MDFHQPHHLPNLRTDGALASPEQLPRQRRGVTPQMHGRFPDYDVLSQARHWDSLTRALVLDRVANPPLYAFFEPAEQTTLEAFCNIVTAQDREPRIPVLRYIDARLQSRSFDGYQHVDLPDDAQVWRCLAQGLEQAATARGLQPFAELSEQAQLEICSALSKGDLDEGVFAKLPTEKVWGVAMRYVIAAFYSHPWAWNEIGFGGPAYPRGYARLGHGQREAWEGEEAFSEDPVKEVHEPLE